MGKQGIIWLIYKLMIIELLLFPSFGFAEVNTWIKKADMPTSRGALSTSVVNGKIYAIGGGHCNGDNWSYVSTVEEYDSVSNTWTKKTDMPTTWYYSSNSVVNGKIYVIGGLAVQEYDPVSDTWSKKADMPTVRGGLSTSAVNGKIYAIGGWQNGIVPTSAVDEYDPVADTWTRKANMPTARYYLSTSVVNGKIYAIGGMKSGFDVPFSTVEIYDPVSDKWSTRNKSDMPTARGLLSASVVNGKIYVIGGYSDCCNFSTVEEYDPVTNRWTTKADMPNVRYGLSTSAINGKIYAIGGLRIVNNKETSLPTVEEYDTGFVSIGVDAKDKLTTKWGKLKGE